MAKMMIDCSDPNDLQALQEAVERKAGSCKITYAKQHQALLEAGKSKSISESARLIALETDETPKAVEHRIRRGREALAQEAEERIESQQSPHVGEMNGKSKPPVEHIGKMPLSPTAQKLIKNALDSLQQIDPAERGTALITTREALAKLIPKAKKIQLRITAKRQRGGNGLGDDPQTNRRKLKVRAAHFTGEIEHLSRL